MTDIVTLIITAPLLMFIAAVSISMTVETIQNAILRKKEFGPYEKLRLENENQRLQKELSTLKLEFDKKCKELEEKNDAEKFLSEIYGELRLEMIALDAQIKIYSELHKKKNSRIKDLEKEIQNLIKKANLPRYPELSGTVNQNKDKYISGITEGRLKTAIKEKTRKRFTDGISIFSTDYPNAFVKVKSSKSENIIYDTSLISCNCYYFEKTGRQKIACKHMLALANELNLITKEGIFVDC